MGYAARRDAYRIALEPFDGTDNWVDIRAGRTYSEWARTMQASANIIGIDSVGRPQFDNVDMVRGQIMLFKQSIIAWSLKADDSDSDALPLTEETFADVLDGDVATWISQQIGQYYQRRRLNEDTLGNSQGSSTAP